MSEKKRRLFVYSGGLNETWCIAGGPDVHEAIQGALHLIESDLVEAMTGDMAAAEAIMFEVREMTDEEVAALPDV